MGDLVEVERPKLEGDCAHSEVATLPWLHLLVNEKYLGKGTMVSQVYLTFQSVEEHLSSLAG